MKCIREGCEEQLTPEQVRQFIYHHNQDCGRRDKAIKWRGYPPPSRPRLAIIPDSDYQMRCHRCGELYDGRKGPWIGLCSLACVGAWAMGEVAGHVPMRVVTG